MGDPISEHLLLWRFARKLDLRAREPAIFLHRRESKALKKRQVLFLVRHLINEAYVSLGPEIELRRDSKKGIYRIVHLGGDGSIAVDIPTAIVNPYLYIREARMIFKMGHCSLELLAKCIVVATKKSACTHSSSCSTER